MANVVLRIETNPNASEEMLGTITNHDSAGASTNDNVSNTSIKANEMGVYSGIENASGEGSNGLTWAEDYLVFNNEGYVDNVENSGGYIESETNPTQFIWGIVPESKEYYVKLTFSNATNLKDITILGDETNKQFPTRAILDGVKEIFNDDYNWAISFENETDTHTIEFTHWNRSNYNAIITQIRVMLHYLDFDKYSLKNIESLSQSTASPNEIFYGVIPNSGSATLIDRSGEILDFVRDNSIENSNLPCTIFVNGKEVQHHIINDSNYDSIGKTISIEMTNDLELWDNITYTGKQLTDSCSAYDLLVEVFSFINKDEDMVIDMLDIPMVFGENSTEGFVIDYLKSINIQYPYLESDTFRNTIDKFCQLAQLQVGVNSNNSIKFFPARPTKTSNELKNIIVIPAKNAMTQLVETVILKNKVKNVGYKEYKTNYDYTDVYNCDITLFKQTEVQKQYQSSNGDHSKLAYSGTYKDYERNLSSNDENCTLFGIYPRYMNNKIDNSERFVLFKVNFNMEEPLKTKGNQWFVTFNSYNANVYPLTAGRPALADIPPYNSNTWYHSGDMCYVNDNGTRRYFRYNDWLPTFTQNPLVSNQWTEVEVGANIFLFNNNYTNNIIKNLSSDFIYPYQYVQSEEEALQNLAHYTEGAIDSIIYDDAVPKIQIIKEGNDYSLYYVLTVTTNDDGDEIYTGELHDIILDGVITVYLKQITKEEIVVNENSDYFLSGNELIQQGTLQNGIKITELNKSNMLNDYKNGISSATISINCGNFYNTNGELVKDFSKGDIINVGDIVRTDKDNDGNSQSTYGDGNPKLWRVTGRNFRKEGVPLIDLELQEIKSMFKNSYNITTNLKNVSLTINRLSSRNEYANIGEISSDDPVFVGDVLAFNVIPADYKQIDKLTINGNEYSNGSEYNVIGDVNLVATAGAWIALVDFVGFGEKIVPLNYKSSGEGTSEADVEIEGIIPSSKIRLSGYVTGTSVDTISFENAMFGDNNNDFELTSNVYSTYNASEVIGSAIFNLLVLTENDKIKYKNYSSDWNTGGFKELHITYLEQWQ